MAQGVAGGTTGAGAGVANAASEPSRNLRELCQQRIFVAVRQVLANIEGEAPGQKRNNYLVLVADTKTLPIVKTVCKMHEMVQEGVYLIDVVDHIRQAMPAFDAVYFVAPTEENVDHLLKDAAGSLPMYRNFHVFFSHKLADDLFKKIAGSPEAVGRLGTFSELNLSFHPHDERCFHLRDSSTLGAVVRDKLPEPEALAETACHLAGLLVSLGVNPRALYARRSAGCMAATSSGESRRREPGAANPQGTCERLNAELRERLTEIEAKCDPWERSAPQDSCQVLLVDRTVDWTALLAHDLRYEAAIFDMLCHSSDPKESKYKYYDAADNIQKMSPLGERGDTLWERYRHMPVWEVNDSVVRDIKAWSKRDEEIRTRSAAGSAASMAQMVSSTLSVLQEVPEHKQLFAKLQVHSDIIQRIMTTIETNKLVSVVSLEQDMIAGVDEAGHSVVAKDVENNFSKLLQDEDIGEDVRTRLLLLFSTTPEGANLSQERQRQLCQNLPFDDQALPYGPQWRCVQRQEKKEIAARRKQRLKAQVKSLASINQQNTKFQRSEPRLRELIEDLAAGKTDPEEFQMDRPSRAVAAALRSAGPARPGGAPPIVVIFVVGGVALPEVRAAHEAAKVLGIDIYIGGSCILTPSAMLEAFREAADL